MDHTGAQNQGIVYNTVKNLGLKPTYIKQLKEELVNDLYQYSLDTKQCVFDDLMIEDEDGCIIGEVGRLVVIIEIVNDQAVR